MWVQLWDLRQCGLGTGTCQGARPTGAHARCSSSRQTGDYYWPCHGSRYDRAGCVIAGSPAPLTRPVPPHYYTDGNTIVTGELSNGTEQSWEPNT